MRPILREISNHTGVSQCGSVAQAIDFVCRNLAQNTPHDFPGTGFG